jgi:hypothetical protein
MHCDQHVRKMVLEYTQMEITARVLLGELPDTTAYHTPRMRNHPCSVFVRSCARGFSYVTSLRDALLDEFEFRFRDPGLFGAQPHGTAVFLATLPPAPLATLFPHRRRAKPFPLAVGTSPRYEGDPVRTYREFYHHDKARFATWTRREPPDWWRGDTP